MLRALHDLLKPLIQETVNQRLRIQNRIIMKSLLLLLLTTFLAVSNLSAQEQADQTVSAPIGTLNGKEFLHNYYQQTFDALESKIKGLNEAQLQFRPAADRWSISQCLEHIVLTEDMLFGFARKGLESTANPERRKEIKITDGDLIKGINDRTHKAKATEEISGKGKYTSPDNALAELQNQRKNIFDYLAKLTEEDLRNHVSDSPFGAVDGYQSFLFIAGHTSRHTQQIEEVKADKNFPKN